MRSTYLLLSFAVAASAFGMEEQRPIDDVRTVRSHAAKDIPNRRYADVLFSGSTVNWTLDPITVATLFTGDFAYSLTVGQGITRVQITATPTSPSLADIDLFVRRTYDPDLDSSNHVIYDYKAGNLLPGARTIVITGNPYVTPGDYRIAMALYTPLNRQVSGTLTATVSTEGVCTYSLSSPVNLNRIVLNPSATTSTFYVNTGSNCAWTASTGASWIHLAETSKSGTGPGTVSYSVDANLGPQREGTITAGGQSFTVVQQQTAVPALGANARIFGQLVSGGGWSTAIYVTNLSDVLTESVSMDFFNSDGTVRRVPFAGLGTVSSTTATLQPKQSVVFETLDDTALEQGWGALYGSSNVAGFAILRQKRQGAVTQEAAVPFVSQFQKRFVLLLSTKNKNEIGCALVNPGSQPVRVHLEFRDASGASINSEDVDLPAMGHTAIAFSQKWSYVAGREGTVVLTAPTAFSVLGLRFTGEGAFTSFEPF